METLTSVYYGVRSFQRRKLQLKRRNKNMLFQYEQILAQDGSKFHLVLLIYLVDINSIR